MTYRQTADRILSAFVLNFSFSIGLRFRVEHYEVRHSSKPCPKWSLYGDSV